MVRPQDMLVLEIGLVNLRQDGDRLVRQAPGPAQILVTLPPQHVAEAALPLPPTASSRVPSFSARPSTLAFSLPDDMDGVGLSLASLLDWTRLVPQSVPVVGAPDPGTSAVHGGIHRTTIEFPLRLLLTHDDALSRWEHLADPFVADGRSELWHTSLLGPEAGGAPLLRAVATAGVLPPGLPLRQEHLDGIVIQTSRHEVFDKNGLPIEILSDPLHAEQFRLTSLGASAHLHGSWILPDTSLNKFVEAGRTAPLASYDHITGLGRDQFVRTAERYFCHTGHQALFVTETRRVFTAAGDGTIVAGLHSERHAEFPQPDISYGATTGYAHQGREMPLTSLHIDERVTPKLKDADPPSGPFFAVLEDTGADYLLPVTGTDQEGRKVSFRMPLLLVPSASGANGSIAASFPHAAPAPAALGPGDARAIAQLDGQEMAIAEPLPDAPGSTCHPVNTLRFDVQPRAQGGDHPLDAVLFVAGAEVREPAVEAFAPGGGRVQVRMNAGYLERGFTDNPSGAYLTMNTPVQLLLKAEQAGGLASPNSSVSEITGRAGVLAGTFSKVPAAPDVPIPVDEVKKAFDIGKLLGIVSLSDILGTIPQSAVTDLAQLSDSRIEEIIRSGDPRTLLPVPVLRVKELAEGAGKELRYVWKPSIKSSGIVGLDDASLVLDSRTTVSTDGLDKSSVSGELTNLKLRFAGLAEVRIARLSFTSTPGGKPDIDASGLELVFEGALSFINNLRSLLPADGFGKGAYIDVAPSGIRAGYSLAIPSIAVGVFGLQNLTLTAGLAIPFEASPIRFRFGICSREDPFLVSVSLFGGGGFFAMEVSSQGIELVEGALEFGGTASLNLGVASGGVSIMAGVYFKLENNAQGGQDITLSGYLRCNGYLSVLGIVSVSVEFYLELSYQKSGGESVIRGRGTLSVSVRIAFFSKTVSLTLERSFAGAPGDPTFAQCVEPDDWDTYCLAYAA